jgi:PKHD-type hydroxylase
MAKKAGTLAKSTNAGGPSLAVIISAAVVALLAFGAAWSMATPSRDGPVPEERFTHHMSASDPPYATFEKLFTDEECDAIIEFGLKQQRQDATISTGRTSSDDTRRGEVAPFQGEEVSWVRQRVLTAMRRANAQSWAYNLPTGIEDPAIEVMQFGLYDHSRKAFYEFHADNGFVGSPHENRKLSLTVQLQDNSSYIGGTLQIRPACVIQPSEDAPEATIASSARGAAIIFPSCLSHTVTPVTTGTRYSLVQWVQTNDAPPASDNLAMSHLGAARGAMDAFFTQSEGSSKMTEAVYSLLKEADKKYRKVVNIWPSDMITTEVLDTFKEAKVVTKGDSRVEKILAKWV